MGEMGDDLEVELSNYESHGVIIGLGNIKLTPQNVTQQFLVSESGDYMRDYIFEGGKLKEIRFNRLIY